MQSEPIWLWIAFGTFIVLMLWLDLAVFNRKSHVIGIKEALGWTLFWVSLAVGFNVGVYYYLGEEKALQFTAGYLIEQSLSVDNLFVILLIFNFFHVDSVYRHRVLFWGIFGALVMRLTMIFVGVELVEHFDFVLYIFGGFLIFTGLRMAFGKERQLHPEHNPVVRLFKRFMPVTHEYYGNHFFVKLPVGKDGSPETAPQSATDEAGAKLNFRNFATPLFIVVLVVEATDLVFALDSIPAILAVSHDPFIVYTSNAFAILGLRSLFFALAGIMDIFHYLKYGLAVVLFFIGMKMVLAEANIVHITTGLSLAIVAIVLTSSVIISLLFPPQKPVEDIVIADQD